MSVSLSLTHGRSLKIIPGPAYDVKVEGTADEVASVTSQIVPGGVHVVQKPGAMEAGGSININEGNASISGSVSGGVIVVNRAVIWGNGASDAQSSLNITVTVPNPDDVDLNLSGAYKIVTLGSVRRLFIDVGSSASVNFESADSSKILVRGSGNVRGRSILDRASLTVMGSGDIEIDRVEGSLDAKVQGSGNITVGYGDNGETSVELTGSGDIRIK